MESPDGTSWLDPETKAAFQKLPPEKLAPATTGAFAIVVLSLGSPYEHDHRVRAMDKILHASRRDVERQLKRKPPFVIKRELTLSDAMLAQFELVCADIISIFLSGEIVANAEPDYLASLYRSMIRADEFRFVAVRVVSIPDGTDGQSFANQFLGPNVPQLPFTLFAMRKKARSMVHWGRRIGANVQTALGPSGR